MKCKHNAMWIVTFIGLCPMTAWAGILSTTGDVVVVAPPPSVATGQRESNTQIILFEEQQDVLLPTDLLVDILDPGTYGPNANLNDFPQGSIPANTRVASYYLHADQVGVTGTTFFSGSVTFDTDILGIAFSTERQSGTVGVLGLPGTTYGSAKVNVDDNDQIVISNDRRTITLGVSQGNGADNMRVITVVPEPTTLTMLAISSLAFFRRRELYVTRPYRTHRAKE